MRPLIAMVVAAGILGMVQTYMSFQKAASAPLKEPTAPTQQASNYQLRFITSFDAAPDPFQLYPAAVEIRRIGADQPLMRFPDPVMAGQMHQAPIYIPAGVSKLVVEARLPVEDRQEAPDSPDSSQTFTVELQFFSTDIDLQANPDASPIAAAVATLQPTQQQLAGETEVNLP